MFWASAWMFFAILCSMKILRALRETVSAIAGRQDLPDLWLGTFAFTIVANFAYWGLVNRVPRRRFVPWSLHGCALCMVAFFVLLRGLEDPVAQRWTLYGFYAWYSAFTMCVISLFWVCMVDQFDAGQAKRMFGPVAAFGTLGGMFGSALTAVVIDVDAISTATLFVLALLALESAVFCNAWRERALRRSTSHFPAASDASRVAQAGVLEGLRLCLSTPRLRWFALFIVLMTGAQTAFYLVQADFVGTTLNAAGPDEITFYYAWKDLLTDALTLTLQVFVTTWLLRRFGVAGALTLVALVAVVGTTSFAATGTLGVLAIVHATWDSCRHGLLRPAREVVFTPLGTEAKYKSKTFLDSFLYRGFDVLWIRIFAGLTATTTAILAIPLALAWIPVGLRLAVSNRTAPTGGPNKGDA